MSDKTETNELSAEDSIKNIIDAIAGGDTVKAGSSFDQVMSTKQADIMDTRKQEFAGQMFASPVEEPSPEVEESQPEEE